ncbi:MAG: amidohydrolase family protein [Bacillota bacterium]|nr:amidohydrolase family protein [Bacillota bacterium]
MAFDLLLKNGLLIDPKHGILRQMDVAVEDGSVAEVAPSIASTAGRKVIDLAGKAVMPGLIDTHVHVSRMLGGYRGFAMLARAGVTTAVDCAGPLDKVLEGFEMGGAGINVAVLNSSQPGHTISGNDPGRDEIARKVARDLDEGAFGIKLMGGHYPMTPEATAGFIAEANRQRCYVAYHAGTTRHGSNFHGFQEAVELAGNNSMHLAHINAYCRGVATGDPIAETLSAVAALEGKGNIISEFHMATVNGTSGRCVGGVPESHVTRTCLRTGGFAQTEAGLRAAFLAGYAHVAAEGPDGSNVLLVGEDGLRYWSERQDESTVGFPVNNRTVAFLCAGARRKDGDFVISALSTDGGGIPRNFLLRFGLLVVEYGLWTLPEFVKQTSWRPSQMLGLPRKGHLGVGADADITVADLTRREAAMTVVGGRIVMSGGAVTGSGGTIICNERGVAALERRGVPYQVGDMSRSLLYAGRS